MGRAGIASALMLAVAVGGCSEEAPSITVGSKNFLEQMLLGEIAAQHLEHRLGTRVGRQLNLGGTLLVHQAIVGGAVDLYPEYLGTAATAILRLPPSNDAEYLGARVRQEYTTRFHLRWLNPLGFNNTFAVVIRRDDSDRLHVRSLSDARRHPAGWVLGVGYEFQQRPDGLSNLLRTYAVPLQGMPKVMDLGLLYRALQQGDVSMIAANSTDGLLLSLDVTRLEDDRQSFPPYHASFVVRLQALRKDPQLETALEELSGKLSDETMRRLNHEVLVQHGQVRQVATEFLRASGLVRTP